ncbi:MAG: sigma-70 family RNA polymerase sigma factor [Gammaproteobacteria bacterium]|nr:sigma-70 family RNA polymerase sigma factor [Gammaproteobacteria bacterium]
MQPSHEWFDELVEETRIGLTDCVRRIVSSPDDVQGILQDAYLKVFVALRKDRPGGHAPVALLYRTARNIAISRLRHQKVVRHSISAVEVAEELRGDSPTTEQQISASQKLNELLLIINSLPPRCRDVFVLRWIKGLSQRAIGEQLGISVSTVEKHLAKGLRYCKDEIQHSSKTAAAALPADLRARLTGTDA